MPKGKSRPTAALNMKGKRHAAGPGSEPAKKPHRFRPGTVSLRQIRRMQTSVDFCTPKAAVERLVREIMQGHSDTMRITKQALMTLQTDLEAYATELFNGTVDACVHAKRVTIYPKDIGLVLKLSGHNLTRYKGSSHMLSGRAVVGHGDKTGVARAHRGKATPKKRDVGVTVKAAPGSAN